MVKSASSCRKTKTVRRGGRRVRILGESAIAWNQTGTPGATGAPGTPGTPGAPGAPGSARSYGTVTLPCTVGGTCTLTNARNATVTHPFTGVFCITFPGADATTMGVLATLQDGLPGEEIGSTVGSCGNVPEVVTRDTSNHDYPFFFAVP